MQINKNIILIFFLALASCKKFVSIPGPINTITTKEIFNTDAQANSALAGMYSQMINSPGGFWVGGVNVMSGQSSDELLYYGDAPGQYAIYANRLTAVNAPLPIWQGAYSSIYAANSIIEGVAASTSSSLHDSARKLLTGEAKFVRAFSYFYLVNLFGDVPLALTVDFNKTANMARTPQVEVWKQIISDLKDAQSDLSDDYYPAGMGRIRPNKGAATALLARAFLYTGDYGNAASQATAVINNVNSYHLENDLNRVFSNTSQEAIWQLQINPASTTGNATSEGSTFLPNPLNTGKPNYYLTPSLTGAFEPGDQRWTAWVDSTDNSYLGPTGKYYYPYKYKIGAYNYQVNGPVSEYSMMIRLAEMYLIRAEAEAHGAAGGSGAAIGDLDIIRARAGLSPLSSSLTQDQVIAAIAHEWQIEFFAEWGHRWLDLKRTGQAHTILSQINYKQPWAGDYQLLYPIPITEIQADHFLVQNPGY